jgi:two-component system cell cycle sensor histidine kinase/response regulator CckA
LINAWKAGYRRINGNQLTKPMESLMIDAFRDFSGLPARKSGAIVMVNKPSYEELEKRVAELEAQNRRFIEVQGELFRSLNFTESLLASIPTPVFYKDHGGRYLGCNKAFSEIMGLESEQLYGKTVQELWPDEHAKIYHQKDLELLENPQQQVYEFEVRDKHGRIRPVIYYKNVFRDEKGAAAGIVGGFVDISDRVRSEKILRASHNRLITVFDSIDATVYVADINTHEILFMNRHMIETFGGDLTGKICWEVFRREPSPCPNCTTEQLLGDNGQPTGVVVWQGKNPVTGRWYINYDRAIEWIDGRMVRLQIATDITEYKKMEDALQKAQKMEAVGTLASGIAHDFNNLLMGIQGRTSLLSVDLDPGHPHAEHTAAINEYIRSAVNLTNQLLGLVRGGKYEVKPVDINALIESTAEMFGRTRKQIRIRIKTAPARLVVNADKRQIEQVLLNIYVNASQAMPNGGDLYLETSSVAIDADKGSLHQVPPGRYVKISLTDTGIGMSEEIRQKVFDPFFTTKEKGRGTGLGLASAYGIIRNHGGMITVYSEVDQGSTFNIYLPSCQEDLLPEAQPAGDLVGGTETILLVDDEAMIVEVGKSMLERLGYRVFTADSGKSAIASVSEMGHDLHLVILDLIMPEVDGGSTFDRIREINPTVPVILSSGYSVNGQATEIMKRGCNGFLQKPFSILELDKKIREILGAGGNPVQQ